jgi:hypothetical protein
LAESTLDSSRSTSFAERFGRHLLISLRQSKQSDIIHLIESASASNIIELRYQMTEKDAANTASYVLVGSILYAVRSTNWRMLNLRP